MPRHRLALISDPHGNLPALDAVLQHIQAAAPDQIICAGDLIGGPHQEQVVARLRASGVILVRGNAEEYPTRFEDGSAPPEWHTAHQYAMARWVVRNIMPETLAFLRSLPVRCTIELPGAPDVCVFHGAPNDTNTHLYPAQNPHNLTRALQETPEPVLVCGHTHIPWSKRQADRLALNPGAVCTPLDGQVGAQYALLDWDGRSWQPAFFCVPYDTVAFIRDYAECGLLACGALPRAHLFSILLGGDWGKAFLDHAYRLSAEAGTGHLACVPNDIWQQADLSFSWSVNGV